MAPRLPLCVGWMCGIGKGAIPLYVFLGGGGDWKGQPPYVFLGRGLSPKKDGGLSCAQSSRPVSLRETGAGVVSLLLEVGVSERVGEASDGKAICC